MKIHENILLFYKKQPIYNPQMVKRTEEEYKKSLRINDSHSNAGEGFGGNDKLLKRKSAEDQWYKYPTTELKIPLDDSRNGKGHPNQKPVALFEYLIKTYSDENEIVLDNCAGSSTTAVACKNTNRRWICIEKEEKYCEISKNRIESWVKTQ
jgi:DNA modification methylase